MAAVALYHHVIGSNEVVHAGGGALTCGWMDRVARDRDLVLEVVVHQHVRLSNTPRSAVARPDYVVLGGSPLLKAAGDLNRGSIGCFRCRCGPSCGCSEGAGEHD